MRQIFKSGCNLQSTEQENSHQREFLMSRNLNLPDHGYGKKHDQDVVERIEGKRRNEEVLCVYARSARDGAIPIESNGLAFESGGEEGSDEDGYAEGSQAVDSDAKLSVLKRKNPHIEEKERCLDQKDACRIYQICAVQELY